MTKGVHQERVVEKSVAIVLLHQIVACPSQGGVQNGMKVSSIPPTTNQNN
jgi:hypothetical protein